MSDKQKAFKALDYIDDNAHPSDCPRSSSAFYECLCGIDKEIGVVRSALSEQGVCEGVDPDELISKMLRKDGVFDPYFISGIRAAVDAINTLYRSPQPQLGVCSKGHNYQQVAHMTDETARMYIKCSNCGEEKPYECTHFSLPASQKGGVMDKKIPSYTAGFNAGYNDGMRKADEMNADLYTHVLVPIKPTIEMLQALESDPEIVKSWAYGTAEARYSAMISASKKESGHE